MQTISAPLIRVATVIAALVIVLSFAPPQSTAPTRTASEGNGWEDLDAAGAVIGALGGLVVGGVTGAMIQSDRWRDANPPQWPMVVTPTRAGGIAVMLSFRF